MHTALAQTRKINNRQNVQMKSHNRFMRSRLRCTLINAGHVHRSIATTTKIFYTLLGILFFIVTDIRAWNVIMLARVGLCGYAVCIGHIIFIKL